MISSIEKIITLPEGRRIEFKEDIGTGIDIIKTVIAFSNNAGGDIFIGIKDNPREIIGIDEKQLILKEEKLANLISNLCLPVIIPDIGVFEYNGKLVLRIHIYPGNHLPYYYKKEGKDKGTYIRIGSTNRKADKAIIEEMERKRQNRSFDAEPVYNVPLEELDLNDFSQFYKSKTNKSINQAALKNLNLIVKDIDTFIPRNAAVLLAKESLKGKYFPYAKIECARFKGTDMSVFLDQFSSTTSIILQPEEVMTFIQRNIARGSTFEGIYRKDRWEYPLPAIREALINAVIHRDYSLSGRDIKVAIYDDMLEITNPGDVMPSINLENLADNPSEIRNRILAPIFKECGLIEQWGTGFKKIIKEMEQYPELELKINEPGLSFQIQFVKKYPSSTPQDTPKHPPRWENLKNLLYGKEIIEFCKEPRTRDEIQDYINVKDRKYFREKILKPLIDQGYIGMTIPEKPNSPKQKYVTVKEGHKNE